MTLTKATETITPPKEPREWSLEQIEQVLSRPIPDSLLRVKEIKGNKITYLPWYEANKILSKYCPGWSWEVTKMETANGRLFIVGRLTIPTAKGLVFRESCGNESLNCSSYGDPSSNAESMAFRRCCARFGLGLYLYDK
jgi:hypothetical protein